MNHSEYYKEINELSISIIEQAMEQAEDKEEAEEMLNDYLIHENVDSHEFVIYYAKAFEVLGISSNDEYMIENLGEESAVEALKSGGLSGLHSALAFWAMCADVQEVIYDLLEEAYEKAA